MKKDLIFFGENGLTSTSANFVANMAKEYVSNLTSDLENIDFLNVEAQLMGTDNHHVLQRGADKEELQDIPNKLNIIAKAKSLIAWLREAIKARDNLVKEAENVSIADYCKMVGKDVPICPEKENELTEEDLIGELSIKDRNRYFTLEAKCAALGKYIHPSGAFALKRKELNDSIKHEHKIDGTGRDAIIRTYLPSVERQDVEDMFFKLQTEHRETQAEFNSIKFKIEKALTEDRIKKQQEYKVRYNAYKNAVLALDEELKEWKLREVQNISALKIIIPNDLKDIYDVISQLKNK